jgi:hypothetical protein
LARCAKIGQLGDVGRYPSCFVAGEWLGTRPLVLGVDVSEGLSVMVAHDEIGVLVLDGPGWWEAARRRGRIGHGWKDSRAAGKGYGCSLIANFQTLQDSAHQLLAATKPFGNMPLAEAQTPQGGRKICSLSHGGRLGLLGQLAALPR